MTKHKKVGGWGARSQLTKRQRDEIATCRNCTLPECYGKRDPACPLHPQHKEYKQMLDALCAAVQQRGQAASTGRALVSAVWGQWHGN